MRQANLEPRFQRVTSVPARVEIKTMSVIVAIAVSGSSNAFAEVASAKTAASACIPGMFCSDMDGRFLVPKSTVALASDTKLDFDTLSMPMGTVIQTNGFKLEIHVRSLKIVDEARIRAFDPASTPDLPPKALNGPDGHSFDRGPNTEGRCGGCAGQSGEAGSSGTIGILGTSGRSAGIVVLEVSEGIEGKLNVEDRGERGGPGGEGGDGGDGGSGEQGGRAETGTFDCHSGPGDGGSGGAAGDGGTGGKGGEGGAGGVVVLKVPKELTAQFMISVEGGPGGEGGPPGKAGNGGDSGFGGRGDGLCQGKEGDRAGVKGSPGHPNNPFEVIQMKGIQGSGGHQGTFIELAQ
jgi:hypothetical protein